jgi:hypothetical protein
LVDLGVLDNVIGVIVVILLLSMVVQSIQTFIKKLSNFKSRQIRKSLENLFEKTAASAPVQGAATADKVLDHFRELGRVSAFNRDAVESISKVDLTKVVMTIEGSSLLPDRMKSALTSIVGTLQEVQTAIEVLAKTPMPPEAAGTLADLRQAVAPLLTQTTQMLDAKGTLKAELAIRDALTVRDVATGPMTKLAAQLHSHITTSAAAAPSNALLQDASNAANRLSDALLRLHTEIAELNSRVRARVDAIEAWYDPVMQGFEERYSRHMKTWAFILSAIITVAVDANLPRLYKRMATDDVSKQRVLREAQSIQDRYLAQIARARQMNDEPTLQELTARLNDELDEATASYPALGLELLDVDQWWNRTAPLEKAKSIIGWVMMAFLLSLGAPFWHDILQSLFGLKNFLREKSETQNVEQRSGAGQTAT